MILFQAKSMHGNQRIPGKPDLLKRFATRQREKRDHARFCMIFHAAKSYVRRTGRACLFRSHQLCVRLGSTGTEAVHEYILGSGRMRERFNT